MMKKPVLMIAALLCLIGASSAYAQTQDAPLLKREVLISPIPSAQYSSKYIEDPSGQEEHTLTVNGETRSYNVYIPPGIKNSTRPHPAIVLLHGANRSGASLIERWKGTANLHNIILLGPHGKPEGWHMVNDGNHFLPAMLADAQKRYAINPKRIYAFGHSAGGSFMFYFTTMYSDVFAATALHAGKFISPEHYQIPDAAKRKIPMMVFVGENDPLFPVDEVEASANAYAQRGHKVTFHMIKDHNHWYYDIATFINSKTWEFFEKQKLP